MFAKHRGVQVALAKELGIKQSSLSKWLKGKFDSARIAEAAERKAIALSTEAR